MKICIIFPNQLFEIKYYPFNLNEIDLLILIEDPLFFKDKERKLLFNPLKLMYQVACMRYYYDYCIDNHLKVKYIKYYSNPESIYKFISEKYSIDELYIINPVDHLLINRINKYTKKYKINLKIFDTPYFFISENDLAEYNENKGTFIMNSFYIYFRKKYGILMNHTDNKPIGGKYSYDKYNRDKFPSNKVNYPKIAKYNNSKSLKYYNYAIKYINKNFSDNIINTDDNNWNNLYIYPITHSTAKYHLKNFILNKLNYFGKYQDNVDKNNPFMFHSILSPMLNIGLLSSKYVLDKIINKVNNKNLNSTEGFIRQLFWREYSRLCYVYKYDEMKNSNYFNNKNKLNYIWYYGNTSIDPIDHSIKSAFNYGYLHHIIRLMFVCNFMNLCHIHPHEIYKWFMEFSLDSYDWVMTNNIYSMGLFADGGKTSTKLYICSSNYISQMSNFKKDGKWDVIWDSLFYYFIYKNYNKLKGRSLRYRSLWNNKNDKKELIKTAKNFLKSI